VSTKRWISDNTAYRKLLPAEVQAVLDKHEQEGSTKSDECRGACMVFYQRHLNAQNPWPKELRRSFELFNSDLYAAIWGPTEFTSTGTLKDYDVLDKLSKVDTSTLFTAGEFDEASPAAVRQFATRHPQRQPSGATITIATISSDGTAPTSWLPTTSPRVCWP
jgi:proline-specific peptidase